MRVFKDVAKWVRGFKKKKRRPTVVQQLDKADSLLVKDMYLALAVLSLYDRTHLLVRELRKGGYPRLAAAAAQITNSAGASIRVLELAKHLCCDAGLPPSSLNAKEIARARRRLVASKLRSASCVALDIPYCADGTEIVSVLDISDEMEDERTRVLVQLQDGTSKMVTLDYLSFPSPIECLALQAEDE